MSFYNTRMWDLKRGDYDYCLSIVFGFAYCMVFLGLCQLLSWASNRVDSENDHDHDDVTNGDHVIIFIREFPGVNPFVLGSIPVVDFNSKDFKDGVECVVCLSELVDGDKTRVLPSCNHQFHADCIDKWFQLHSTCPICRSEVGSVQELGTRPDLGVAVSQDTILGDATSSCDQLHVIVVNSGPITAHM